MPHTSPNSKGATLLLLIFCCCCGCSDPGLPEPGTTDYQKTIDAYYKGLAAIASGTDIGGEELLLTASTLAPNEPAIWANLGLLALRQNDLEAATTRLEQAHTLAPENPDVLFLLGQSARIQGDDTTALRFYQAAIKADSTHLRGLFAVVQTLTADGKQADAQIEQLHALVPNNLAVLLERARLAATRQDAEALENHLGDLALHADAWPEIARAQLATLQSVTDPSEALAPLQVLRNVLLRVPAFRHDLHAVQPPTEEVAALLPNLLRLPTPSPEPAPADTLLQFIEQAEDQTVMAIQFVHLNGNLRPNQLIRTAQGWAWGHDSLGTTTAFGEEFAFFIDVDLNNDFLTDLVGVGEGGVRFFRQDATGTWAEVAVPLPADRRGPYSRGWKADLDLEGDLDLILAAPGQAPLVLQNNGDFTFSTLDILNAYTGLTAFAWADLDADGDPDAALVDESGRLHVSLNERSGVFVSAELPGAESTHAIGIADMDRDATFDLLSVNAQGTVQQWHPSTGGPWTSTARLNRNTANDTHQLFIQDFDNNGAEDLLLASADQAELWLAKANGTYDLAISSIPAHIRSVTDLNGDGLLDLAGLKHQAPVQFLGEGSLHYGWQIFRPRAAQSVGDQRINSFGQGGEIEIRTGLQYQKKQIAGPVVHLGLGSANGVGLARIIWPNGSIQAEFDLVPNQVLLTRQRLKGSCPWLFTHDGKGLQFVTDFLWRSPLGLRINALETAGIMTTEDRVKIRGDQMVARDGQYDLRITAELWETHFFDHVSLMVVDHPEGTEVWLDERFAFPPPSLALKTTGPLQPIRQVLDDTGTDVTEVALYRDGQYITSAGLGAYQGITRRHTLEIDLGPDAIQTSKKWLIAQGWVYPTDSSINVAVAQGNHAPPEDLTLEVQDAQGNWQVAQTGLGFPSGKNKTVLIDVSAATTVGGTQRIRLSTNLEIYWDALGWAAPVEAPDLRTTSVAPAQADLRYRGYSLTRMPNRTTPEIPIYDSLAATAPVWRDLEGYYTRFGDIRELLLDIDDRYVIMNAGDEMRFSFKAPATPPPGWKRDFVLIGDGWVKDGDYNTGFSRTVLPLPLHHDGTYSTPPQSLEDDPGYQKHQNDWAHFHTRYVSPASFHIALVPPP